MLIHIEDSKKFDYTNLNASCVAYFGDGWRLFEKYIEPIVNALIAYYRFIIKKGEKPRAKENAVTRYKSRIYLKKGSVVA